MTATSDTSGSPATGARNPGNIAFSGPARGPGPLMWAQRLLWNDSQWMGEEAHYFNMALSVPVPDGLSYDRVMDALSRVVHRHEAFRSRITLAADGEPLQEVLASGELPVLLAEASDEAVDEVAARCREELSGRSFDLLADRPARLCVVTVRGVPARVVMVLSHVFADGGATRVLSRELAELMSAPVPPASWAVPAPQPLDRAAHEQSPAGQRLSARALERLEQQLRTMPQTMFPGPRLTPDPHRFKRLEMSSPALTEALRRIAGRDGTTTSNVLLAATALMLGAFTGNRRVAFKTILGNRSFPDLKGIVSSAVSNGLVRADLTDGSFTELVRSVAQATKADLLRSQCDPAARDRLMARVNGERGVHLDLSSFFNDIRVFMGGRSAEPDHDADLDALTSRTRLAWIGEWDRQDAKFFFHARTLGDCDHVYAMIDTAFMPAESAERLMRGLERVLITCAGADLPLSELRDLVAADGCLPPARGADWALVDECWVHLPDVVSMLSGLLPGRRVEAGLGEGADGPVLTARIFCDEPVDVAELRRAAHRALPDFPSAMVPALVTVVPTGSAPEGPPA
ncbi:condensation domain-containing protein [Streptomyces sp. NBC_00525]|uniref:condensation domain-containing protein n=1 Tax=Streptomyces sp. NBC_00525 TaxID=2903660 RepID=UPI002E821318|nr:condensation domain-containing protein [Streptomyces sp. NBC_00525]WUC96718.1 condensation domain-containing protein [Streptomyces sp. NBC_00525]